MTSPAFVTRVALAALLLSGCKAEQTCVPGRQEACPCLDGADGVQVCNDDGTRFETCQCESGSIRDQPDAGADAGSASGGAGSGGTAGSPGLGGTAGSAGRGGGGGAIEAGRDGGAVPITTTVQLAFGQDHPTGIAVYGSQVYWANEGDGTIVGCDVAACGDADRNVLVSDLFRPRAIAIDAQSLYWLDAGADGMQLSVSSCPRAGCDGADPTVLFTADVVGNGLAIDDTHLYIGAWETLLRCPLTGCTESNTETLASGGGIAGVAVDASHVYFVRANDRQLFRCPLAGCGDADMNSSQLTSDRFPLSIATDGSVVYWTNYDFYMLQSSSDVPTLNHCPAPGCSPYAPSTVSSGDIAPWGVALDAASFFWTDHVKGQITRTPRPWSG